ncbi:hypothetical protein KVG88_30185 [Pseudomonas sp. SWRI74]|uniref:Uncharacterized protein n=1 Tax=Pseudomonas azerbaijanoccidentalis TaxID=2842347 RepID=A0ABS6QZH8_9PSED|nr:hypothetical protein [Pseudomonas azerbaijanoccidentalis]MBV4524345.1 hypothetical protein [Pseudomonas azerbaijanoccidentalis]
MAEQERKDFETQCLVLAVKNYGYKQGEALLKTVLERRTNGTYSVEWVEGAWIGYQAGRESIVVQMPDAHSYTVPDVAGAVILDCVTAIQKAGGKAKL